METQTEDTPEEGPVNDAREVNFDGIVGPTHSYAGLSYGNIASLSHRAMISNPREAALQGLTKAKAMTDLGLTQGFIPPQERPDIDALKRLGFSGSDAAILESTARVAPEILAAASSASSMWTANAATVSPSADCADSRVHFTAANLNQKLHRSLEHETTTRILQAIFRSELHFAHHPALIASDALGDEGAANHTRFCRSYSDPGLEFFVYGRAALDNGHGPLPKKFPARQTREASEAIARLHQLRPENTVFVQQNPDSIDGGAFHNDVISVGNRNVLFYHEQAFLGGDRAVDELSEKYHRLYADELIGVRVRSTDVSLQDAVKSYLFNSQLISLKNGRMALIAPKECEETPSVKTYLDQLVAKSNSSIQEVKYFDLRQSMRNGGGPACLRLRVVLTESELAHTNPHALLDDKSFVKIKSWIEKHYRDRLTADEMRDPKLLIESRTALDELTQIMDLGAIYRFQREG